MVATLGRQGPPYSPSLAHMFTRFPKGPNCPSCQRGKLIAVPRRRGSFFIEAERRGEHLIADYIKFKGEYMVG
eukprot:8470187-Lingulodinium_polyedra.AAC.1